MTIDWIEKHLKEAENLIYDRQIDEGLNLLNRLLFEEPGYAALHNHLGWAYYYHAQQSERAERHFQAAIKFEPEFAPPYQHLGNMYVQSQRYDQALTILEKGITKPGNRVAMFELIAQAYELKKEYTKAIKYYKEAMVASLGHEANNYSEGIKRCRKKRWVLLLSF